MRAYVERRARMSPRVVVTYPASEDELILARAQLTGLAEVTRLPGPDDPARGEMLSSAVALLAWHPDRELAPTDWAGATQVRFLQTISAGLDHVSFDRLPATVTVAGNAGAYAAPMAEHVLAMVLGLAKRLVVAHQELAAGRFDQQTPSRSVAGRTAVILGYGGIGRAVARLLRPFGIHVIGVNRSGRADESADEVVTVDRLDQVLPRAEILVISLPLTRATVGLIGARELALMPAEAILVNVARGEIVDEDALYRHLVEVPTFLAGIDAWWVEPFRHGRFELGHPFLTLPNVLGSPHNSGVVPEANAEAVRLAAANVARFLHGQAQTGVAGPEDRYRS